MSKTRFIFVAFCIGFLAIAALSQYHTIEVGSTANDGTGDVPRTAGQKLNSNFVSVTTFINAQSNVLWTAIGTKQDSDAVLTDLSGLSLVQGDILYFDGSNLERLAAGTSNQFLKTFGSGFDPGWATVSAGSGIPSGGDTMVQFNQGGSFGAISNLTFDVATGEMLWDSIIGPGILRLDAPFYTTFSWTNQGAVYLEDAPAFGTAYVPVVNTDGKLTSGGITENNLVVTNAASTNFITQVADVGTPASGDLLPIVDVSTATRKYVTISSLPTGGGGEANTASTLGSGIGVWADKSGVDLRFNALNSAQYASNANIISIQSSALLTNIDHYGTFTNYGDTVLEGDVVFQSLTASKVLVLDGSSGVATSSIDASKLSNLANSSADLQDQIDAIALAKDGTMSANQVVVATGDGTIGSSSALTYGSSAFAATGSGTFSGTIRHAGGTNTSTFQHDGAVTFVQNINANGNIVGDGGTQISKILNTITTNIVSSGNQVFGSDSSDTMTINGSVALDPEAAFTQSAVVATNSGVVNFAQGMVQTTNISGNISFTVEGLNSNEVRAASLLITGGGNTVSFMGTTYPTRASGLTAFDFKLAGGTTNIYPDYVTSALLAASTSDEVGTDRLVFSANSDLTGTTEADTILATNRINLLSSELLPQSNLTNYTADFTYGERYKNLTNHIHISAVSNGGSPAAPLYWTASGENLSGSTLTVSVATNIKRSGTNWVNIPNGSAYSIALKSIGSNITNTLASIQVFDSP